MNKPYWNGGTGFADGDSDFADSGELPGLDERGARRPSRRAATTALYDDAPQFQPEYTRNLGYDDDTQDFGEPLDYDDYDDFDDYGYYRPDTRWRWVAAIAGIILLVALVGTAVSLRGGDSSTAATTPTPATPAQDAVTTTPRTVTATMSPAAPAAPLPPEEALPETVVTVPSNPSAHQGPVQPAPPPPAEVDPVVAARTITYTVTGDRQLFDLVTVIYTDEQGFPRTDINVALPWTRTVVLNPGVSLKSVNATSIAGRLNCSISDGTGALLAQQNAGTILAACSN